MIYLTYEEYANMGGVLDLTAFNRNIYRTCGIIDNVTHKRVEGMTKVPQNVKALCLNIVEYLARNATSDVVVSSRSQSAGGVSETESYLINTKEEVQLDIDNMVVDYLMSETDDNGTPLLYRGCSR